MGIAKCAVLGIVALSMSACSTVFNYAPVERVHTVNTADIGEVIGEANAAAGQYLERAASAANTTQILEVPIIGSAIAAATSLAFGAHPDYALVAAITGGSAASFNAYYNPRARANIALSAAHGMKCLASLGQRVQSAFKDQKSAKTLLEAMPLSSYYQDTVEARVKSSANKIIAEVSTDVGEIATKLSDGMDRINGKVLERNQAASVTPDYDSILNGLQERFEAGQKKQELVNTALGEIGIPQSEIPDLLNAPDVKFEIKIDTEVTKCVGLAGAT